MSLKQFRKWFIRHLLLFRFCVSWFTLCLRYVYWVVPSVNVIVLFWLSCEMTITLYLNVTTTNTIIKDNLKYTKNKFLTFTHSIWNSHLFPFDQFPRQFWSLSCKRNHNFEHTFSEGKVRTTRPTLFSIRGMLGIRIDYGCSFPATPKNFIKCFLDFYLKEIIYFKIST